MSHVTKGTTVILDLDALRAAVASVGAVWHEGQDRYKWFGRFVGDAPLPEGVKVGDLGKCVHAISVSGAEYEIGVIRQGDHWMLIHDAWAGGKGLHRALGQNLGRLHQEYNVQRVATEARRRGYRVQTQRRGGRIRLRLQGR